MQPLAVGEKTYHARIRRTALSINRQQPRIHYNSTMEISKVHRERKYQRQRQSTTPGGSEPENWVTGYRLGVIVVQRRWSEQKESQPFG